MPAAGCELKKTLPCTLALPAEGFSFSVPVPELMTPLSSAELDEEFAFAPPAFALDALLLAAAELVLAGEPALRLPENLQPRTKTAKSRTATKASLRLIDMGWLSSSVRSFESLPRPRHDKGFRSPRGSIFREGSPAQKKAAADTAGKRDFSGRQKPKHLLLPGVG